MKFVVVGAGYVGLSLSILISTKFYVTLIDKDKRKIKKLQNNISPIKDKKIESYLFKKKLNLNFSYEPRSHYLKANYIIIATPTNYNEKKGLFNTKSVEKVINDIIKSRSKADIIIKSTIPIGFTDKIKNKLKKKNIYFSPEFLRETNALYDNLYPSRIIIGENTKKALKFGEILADCALKKKSLINLIYMSSKEAEAVKLFANTYLAMRVSFFNELDSFSEVNKLNTENMIKGISSDHRIGDYYNNPSFGYGGYCLPKDTKQLLYDFKGIPNKIITSVVESNSTRKKFIIDQILNKSPKKVGVYRLLMKSGSDNFRESAIVEIVSILKRKKIDIYLFEPLIKTKYFDGIEVINDLNKFSKKCDLIIANRSSKELEFVREKVYTRDVFGNN
tara:strand:+ start:8374 stop:9546 length:1173 start_codon:yes stop_codon:yes gene_type:complete